MPIDPDQPFRISWKRVFELESGMSGADRLQSIAMLEELETSQRGQETLGESLAIQLRLSIDKLLDLKELQSGIPLEKEAAILLSRRKEAPKILLSVLSDTEKNFPEIFRKLSKGGGAMAHQEKGIIFMNFSIMEQVGVSSVDSQGVKQLIPEPFFVTLGHEMQHVIDGQRQLITGEPDLSQACLEEKAVQTGNRLLQEKHMPLRNSYASPVLDIQTVLQERPFGTSIADLRETLTLNGGCKGFTPAELNDEVRKTLVELGIDNNLASAWVAGAIPANKTIIIPQSLPKVLSLRPAANQPFMP